MLVEVDWHCVEFV